MADDYTMIAGDTTPIKITVTDWDGDDFDLTSCTVTYAIAAYRGGTALVTKSTGGSGIALSADTNIAIVTLDPADTASLSEGRYYHECQVIEGSEKYTVIDGEIYIKTDMIT